MSLLCHQLTRSDLQYALRCILKAFYGHISQCIRDRTGAVISSSAYTALQTTAKINVFEHLFKLPTPPDPAAQGVKKTKTYYMTYYPAEYRKVLLILEDAEPLLRLCAPHWKADHVLQRTLTSLKGKVPHQAKSGAAAEQETVIVEGAIESANSGKRKRSKESDDGDKGKDDVAVKSKGKKRSKTKSVQEATASVSLSDQLATLGATASSCAEDNDVIDSAQPGEPEAPTRPLPRPRPRVQPNPVDVNFIVVDHSISSLRAEFTLLVPGLSCGTDLLNSMEKAPGHFVGEPSEQLLSLISALESANPNAPEISDDETNESWGHRQLSGTWRQVLTTWESVGKCTIACELIGAVVKTCKVARHLCFERKIDNAKFLCDAYLEQIVEKLWDCWKDAGGPVVVKGKPPAHPIQDGSATILAAPSSIDDSTTSLSNQEATDGSPAAALPTTSRKLEIERLLSGLFVEDLKSWTEKFKVGTVSKKKEGYRAAILGSLVAFSESGFAELQALSQARKALKKTKKGPET